jgi:nitrite reductase/ring-hydroxylating ferredoxin subunit
MAADERLICASTDLGEGGDGVRFEVHDPAGAVPAFAIRYGGKVYAYLNRCAHVPVQLDWLEGKFFELSRHALICAVHGAQYDPRSGRCFLGPCKGASLRALDVEERDGSVYLLRAGPNEGSGRRSQ